MKRVRVVSCVSFHPHTIVDNYLSGTVPYELGDASTLEVLNLSKFVLQLSEVFCFVSH